MAQRQLHHLYDKLKDVVELFEQKYILKDGTLFKYDQAYNYFEKTLTVMNAKHVEFLEIATSQYFKALRPRKARIYMLIIDGIASMNMNIVFDIFSNNKYQNRIPIKKIIDHTHSLAKKYPDERAFVGQAIHLLVSIAVASCNYEIWLKN